LWFSLQETYEKKKQEHVAEMQKKEEEMRQMFVVRVKEKEAELKEAEKEVRIVDLAVYECDSICLAEGSELCSIFSVGVLAWCLACRTPASSAPTFLW